MHMRSIFYRFSCIQLHIDFQLQYTIDAFLSAFDLKKNCTKLKFDHTIAGHCLKL